jgi:hypothetical protein
MHSVLNTLALGLVAGNAKSIVNQADVKRNTLLEKIAQNTENNNDTDISDGVGQIKIIHGIEAYTFTGLDATTLYYFEIYPFSPGALSEYYQLILYLLRSFYVSLFTLGRIYPTCDLVGDPLMLQ